MKKRITIFLAIGLMALGLMAQDREHVLRLSDFMKPKGLALPAFVTGQYLTNDGTALSWGALDLSPYIRRDGTTPLTADWNVGAFSLTMKNLTLDNGTATGFVTLPDGSIVYGGQALTPIGSLTGVAISATGTNTTTLQKNSHGLTLFQGDIVAITSCTTASNRGIYTYTGTDNANYLEINGVLTGGDTDIALSVYRNARAIDSAGTERAMTILTKINPSAHYLAYNVDVATGNPGKGLIINFGSRTGNWGSGVADHYPFKIYRHLHREGDLFNVDGNGAVKIANNLTVSDGLIKGGNVTASAIGSMLAPTVTSSTSGSTTWSYVYVVNLADGSHAAASAVGSVATGPADLTGQYNLIRVPYIEGAYSIDVYRMVAGTTPATLGKIISGQVATLNAGSYTFCYDAALAGDGTTAPSTNNTGYGVFAKLGVGTSTPSGIVSTVADENSQSLFTMDNFNAGAAAGVGYKIKNGNGSTDYGNFVVRGTGYTTSGAFKQDALTIAAGGGLSGGMSIISGATDATAGIRFYTGGNADINLRGGVDTNGNIYNESARITVGSGTGLTVNVPANINRQIYKVTVTYAGFSAAALTADKVIATLPAKTKIVGFYADTTTEYTGGAVSAATLIVGKSAGGGEYIASHDVFTAATIKGLADADMGTELVAAALIQGGAVVDWTTAITIYARLTTTGANTSALTAGSTTFYIETESY